MVRIFLLYKRTKESCYIQNKIIWENEPFGLFLVKSYYDLITNEKIRNEG